METPRHKRRDTPSSTASRHTQYEGRPREHPASGVKESELSSVYSSSTNIPIVDGDKDSNINPLLLSSPSNTSPDALRLLYEAGRQQIEGDDEIGVELSDTYAYRKALQAWKSLCFVQDGLFTAKEALTYIDFFYSRIAPFSPVAVLLPVNQHQLHAKMLDDSPMLVLAMLTIASRYCQLNGPGAVARAYTIHERLSVWLQNMITRLFWAQDRFVPANSAGSLRSPGTVAALCLLCEWHPRSAHFPPGQVGMNITYVPKPASFGQAFSLSNPLAWLEWSWRSDRMTWSLLGNALTLATEIGMSTKDDDEGANQVDVQQAVETKHLLCILSTHVSVSLGWDYLLTCDWQELEHKNADYRLRLWARLAQVMREAKKVLYSSKKMSQKLLRTFEYLGPLHHLNEMLRAYKAEFLDSSLTDDERIALDLESDFVRVYVNSIALQSAMEDQKDAEIISHPINGRYIEEVIEGATGILSKIQTSLLINERLKYMTARMYSRVMTASVFLLKANSFGDQFGDRSRFLDLIEGTGRAFLECSMDDANLAIRWGLLLTQLVIKQRQVPSEAITRRDSNRNGNITQQEGNSSLSDASSYDRMFNDPGFEEFTNSIDFMDWLSFPIDPFPTIPDTQRELDPLL